MSAVCGRRRRRRRTRSGGTACLACVGGSPRRGSDPIEPESSGQMRILKRLLHISICSTRKPSGGSVGDLLQARWGLELHRFLPAEPPSASKPPDDAFSVWDNSCFKSLVRISAFQRTRRQEATSRSPAASFCVCQPSSTDSLPAATRGSAARHPFPAGAAA